MCIRGNALHFEVLSDVFDGLSDHAPLVCRVEGPKSTIVDHSTPTRTVYKWVEGTRISDYSSSWQCWEAFGNDSGFVSRF